MIERPLSITITTGTVIKTMFVLAGAWLVYTLFDVVLVILTAIVIASAIEPATKWFTARRVPRVVAVLFVFLGFLATVFGIFYFFLPIFLSEVITLVSSLSGIMDTLTRAPGDYVPVLGASEQAGFPVSSIVQELRMMVQEFSSNAFFAASNVFGGVLSFGLILIFSFYFAMQEKGIEEFLSIVTPAEYEPYIVGLWRRAQHKIGLWMQGQLLLGVIMGVLVFLGLTILGVKHALALAVFAGMFEIIPLFGPTLAAIPAVAFAFADGGLIMGLIVIGLYVMFQQFENHLIYPLVVTKVVGVPPLLVILALVIGAKVAGFLGILLAVPIAAAIQEVVSDLNTRRLAHQQAMRSGQ